jgi:photosystem II stability/assembly factor-like uncharacterized protein
MRRIFFFTLAFSFFFISKGFGQKDTAVEVKYFNTLSELSIRALEVINDSVVWFAADKGRWGYTNNAGRSWNVGPPLIADGLYLDFRSIAVLNDSTVLVLSVASPAYLFKTTDKGKNWKMVYTNADKNIFFDSMKFSDAKNGVAVSDPIGGCIQVISTTDAGEFWDQEDCTNIPQVSYGEAMFASSNTCLDIYKNHVWFITGGKKARVFHSRDGGKHFEVFNTPIAQGEKMTGSFSMDFFNDSIGVIAGGNYEKTDSSIVSLAITKDSGKAWKEIKGKKPFFGSCVQFESTDEFFVTGHDGTFICDYKKKQIKEIKDGSGAELKFQTLRFSPSHKTVWLAGDKGRIAFITFTP